MLGINYKKTVTNESNGDGSLKQDTNNKTGAVGNKFEKTVTNESNGAVGNELEKNIMSESNGDCSRNEDRSMTGTVSNELEKNVMNESNGDGSLNVDISKTGPIGKELERTVMNQSKGDCSLKGRTNNLEAFGKELQIANEIQVDKEMREDKTENDVIIETDTDESCDIVNGISGSKVVTAEKETTVNSLNPVVSGEQVVTCGEQFHDSECDRSPIQKINYDDKDDTCNSDSRVVTVEKETTANTLIPVASGEQVVTCGEQFNDSECDRSPIQKVTYDDKDDTCNSDSRVVTVEMETTANTLIPAALDEQVVTCGEQFNENECDRSPIQKVTYDDKDDICNSESHAQEKIVKSSDIDSSDDENLPL